jgi:mono/diheme cytochrome c family protein
MNMTTLIIRALGRLAPAFVVVLAMASGEFGSAADEPPAVSPAPAARPIAPLATPAPASAPAASTTPAASTPDPAVIAAGQAAFNSSCTTCHDAARALDKSKSYSGWLATIGRMAGKEGADISPADFQPIAAYLASRSPSAATEAGGAAALGGEAAGDGSGWSFATTFSTLYRGASDAFPLENPGFFADIWLSAGYQSSGPWRASVTVCTSCHSQNNGAAGTAYSLEVVDASATLDLRHMFTGCRCDDGRELLVKAGRFIVPFGAIASMSNPGVYRTVTYPLMFNMGRRVLVPNQPPLQPVLPAPFSDEGIDFIYKTPVIGDLIFTADAYAVNGLQGTGSNIFNLSRAYFDNNEDPSGGGRMTLGNDFFRLGTSVLSGNLANQGQPHVYYTLSGADATVQISQRLRYYFEYAQRRQDSVAVMGTKESTRGTVNQLELQLYDQPFISVLARYDTLEHSNLNPGSDKLSRTTEGFNIGLPGGSLLMINHERWMPKGARHVDVLGVRWVVSL